MAHEVKLMLRSVFPDQLITTVLNTTSSGWDLMELNTTSPVVDPRNGRVVESMIIRLTGTSLADLRTKITAILNAADVARRFEVGESDLYVLMSVQGGDTGNGYRSSIHAMEVQIPNSIWGSDWANKTVEVTIVYERDGWWERDDIVTTITATNPNGSGSIIYMFNCNDGVGSAPATRANYLDIDTSDMVGDVATPLFINIHNSYNNAAGNMRFYIGGVGANAVNYLPGMFYEAEDASGGTPTADAGSSGGDYNLVALSADAEADLLTWTPNNVYFMGSYWYKVITRFSSANSIGNVKFRWKIRSGTSTIWQGPQFLLENATNFIQEMGEVPLPPIGAFDGTITMTLTGQRTTASTETLYFDYIQLMAAHCAIKAVGLAPMEYNEDLNIPYNYNYSSNKTLAPMRTASAKSYRDWYSEWSNQLMLAPGLYYRLHFVVQTETAALAEIARTFYALVAYYPRYRGIGE